jgi:hypothetical protein
MAQRLAIALFLLVAGTGAVLYYYWQRATQLPAWYAEGGTSVISSPAPAPAHSDRTELDANNVSRSNQLQIQPEGKSVDAKVAQQVQKTPAGQPVEVQLSQREINHLFTAEITHKTEGKALSRAIKGVNTMIQDGQIESGAVVDLADVPANQLSSNEQNAIARLVKSFPALSDRKVYIALVGKPTIVNHQMVLGEDTRIKVGDLSFSTAELAQRLGVSEEQLKQQINLGIRLGNLKVQDVQLEGDRAILRGEAN